MSDQGEGPAAEAPVLTDLERTVLDGLRAQLEYEQALIHPTAPWRWWFYVSTGDLQRSLGRRGTLVGTPVARKVLKQLAAYGLVIEVPGVRWNNELCWSLADVYKTPDERDRMRREALRRSYPIGARVRAGNQYAGKEGIITDYDPVSGDLQVALVETWFSGDCEEVR